MKLKKENGFTGIDITIALLILTISISIIATLTFNISSNSQKIERKTEATNIAIDVIEKIKILSYTQVESNSTEINKILQEANQKNEYNVAIVIQKYNETERK